MGLIKDLAAYGIQRAMGGTAKPGAKRAQPGETPGQESLDRAAAGPDQKKRSTGSDLAAIGEKRLASGGKRGSANTGQYSVGSMGLAGSIPGQDSDLGGSMDNSRSRKRSNGKVGGR